jgi:diguanylate cyclase (GGDEF)-like protein
VRASPRTNRYVLAIGALAFGATLVVAAVDTLTENARNQIQDRATEETRVRGLALQLSDVIHDQELAVLRIRLGGGADAISEYDDSVAAQKAIVAQVPHGTPGLEAVEGTIGDLDDAVTTWQKTVAEPTIAAARAGRTAPAIDDGGYGTVLESLFGDLVAQLDQAQAALVAQDDEVAFRRLVGTAIGLGIMVLTALVALTLIHRYGRTLHHEAIQANVLNRFTEVTSFAIDDNEVASSNLEALALLCRPDAAVTHVLNRSKDRAVPEAVLGDAIADVLPLHALSRCAGLVRGTMYVTDDSSAPLSVHCPVYPTTTGTIACVPLNSGESVGAVHLYWSAPFALPLEIRGSVARIAEHAALAIGNRRLLAALHGQANTDPRTGLSNSRAFDLALEQALQARTAEESLAVLMVDIDHFKDFNDRHGHPAGDEALRAFAGVLRGCLREGDQAARYGGEEFAVLLADVDAETAQTVAERIRSRTETTIISLSPGITDRITVSIGIAMAPVQGVERVVLLRTADEALYRAKSAGRNRVIHLVDAAAA